MLWDVIGMVRLPLFIGGRKEACAGRGTVRRVGMRWDRSFSFLESGGREAGGKERTLDVGFAAHGRRCAGGLVADRRRKRVRWEAVQLIITVPLLPWLGPKPPYGATSSRQTRPMGLRTRPLLSPEDRALVWLAGPRGPLGVSIRWSMDFHIISQLLIWIM